MTLPDPGASNSDDLSKRAVNSNGQNPNSNFLSQIVPFLELHPGMWLLSGLLIYLVAAGYLTINMPWQWITFTKQSDRLLQGCLMFFGTTLFCLGIYGILSGRFGHSKSLILVIVSAWLLSSTAIGCSCVSHKSNGVIIGWGYNLTQGTFDATISDMALKKYSGQHMLFTVQRENDQIDSKLDPAIDKSHEYLVPDPSERQQDITVACPVTGKAAKLGDSVTCSLIAVPPSVTDEKIAGCKTIQDITNLEGVVVEAVSNQVTASNVDEMIVAYQQLPPDQKAQFLQKTNLNATPVASHPK